MIKSNKNIIFITLILLSLAVLLLVSCQGTQVDKNSVTITGTRLIKIASHEYASFTDEENVFCIEKDEEFIVEITFSNPKDYRIHSISLDNTFILASDFLPSSTNSLVRFTYTLPELESEDETEIIIDRTITIKKFNFTFHGNPVEHNLDESIVIDIRQDPQFSLVLHLNNVETTYTIRYMQVISSLFSTLPANYQGIFTEENGAGDRIMNYYFFSDQVLYVHTYETFTFEIDEENEEVIVTGLTLAGAGFTVSYLEIPDEYEGFPVKRIANDAFENRNFINIKIPNTIETIGNNAFKNCTSLITVLFLEGGENLHYIGNSAFEGTVKITRFTFPTGLRRIGNSAFKNSGVSQSLRPNTANSYSTDLYIPDYIEHIEAYAFSGTKYNRVRFWEGSNLQFMGDYAFSDMPNLTSVSTNIAAAQLTLPGITFLGNFAFYRNPNLNSVTLGWGLERIGHSAFRECAKLKTVVVHKDVKYIGNNAFMGCDIETFTLAQDSVLEEIGNGAFQANRKLASLNLVNAVNLIKIGIDPFYQCDKLRQVRLSAVTPPQILDYTNPNNTSKSLLNLTNRYLKFYVPDASLAAYEIAWAEIADGIANREPLIASLDQIIGELWAIKRLDNNKAQLFDSFSSNTNITVPDSLAGRIVTEIGPYAFHDGLVSVTLPATIHTIHERAFFHCSNLVTVNFSDLVNLQYIGIRAFSNTNLSSFTATSSLAVIEEYSFNATPNLSFMNLEASNNLIIKSNAITGSAINSVYFGANIQLLSGAFSICTSLTYLSFQNESPVGIASTAFTSIATQYTVSVPTEAAKTVYQSENIFRPNTIYEVRESQND